MQENTFHTSEFECPGGTEAKIQQSAIVWLARKRISVIGERRQTIADVALLITQ